MYQQTIATVSRLLCKIFYRVLDKRQLGAGFDFVNRESFEVASIHDAVHAVIEQLPRAANCVIGILFAP